MNDCFFPCTDVLDLSSTDLLLLTTSIVEFSTENVLDMSGVKLNVAVVKCLEKAMQTNTMRFRTLILAGKLCGCSC